MKTWDRFCYDRESHEDCNQCLFCLACCSCENHCSCKKERVVNDEGEITMKKPKKNCRWGEHRFLVMPGEVYFRDNNLYPSDGSNKQIAYRMLLCECGETKEIIAEDHRAPSANELYPPGEN